MKPPLQHTGGIPLFRTPLEQLDKILENVLKDKPELAGKGAGGLASCRRGAEAPLPAVATPDWGRPRAPHAPGGFHPALPGDTTVLGILPCWEFFPGQAVIAQPGPPLRKWATLMNNQPLHTLDVISTPSLRVYHPYLRVCGCCFFQKPKETKRAILYSVFLSNLWLMG